MSPKQTSSWSGVSHAQAAPAPSPPAAAGALSRLRCGLQVLALVAVLAAVALLLEQRLGPPRWPASLPSRLAVQLALQSPETLPPWLLSLLSLAGWLVWLWLAGTLLLQLVLAVADAATGGARWVASLQRLVAPLTLPLIRRAAQQAVVAVTVVQLASRVAPTAAAAAPAPPAALVAQAGSPGLPGTALVATLPAGTGSTTATTPAGQPLPSTSYTVHKGDNLWSIAARLYGDGEAWPTIYNANVGHPMRDGATFPRDGVIQEGWVLRIPAPRVAAQQPPVIVYVVQQDDNLSLIARRYYGDAGQWPRLFAANRGAHLPDGHTLTDPNLIWPGLRLVIPAAAAPAEAVSAPAAVPAAPQPPAGSRSAAAPSVPASPAVAAHPLPHGSAAVTPAAPAPLYPPSHPPLRRPDRAAARASAALAASESAAASPAPPAGTPAALPTPAPVVTTAQAVDQRRLPLALFAPGAAALAGALAGGATVLLARRRFRTSLDQPPLSPDADAGVTIHEGFADAAYAPTFAGRLDAGTEPAILVAEQVLTWLALEEGLSEVAVVTVGEGRHSMDLTLQAGLAAQERLLALGSELGERLGGQGSAVRTSDHDILLRLRKLTVLRLAARPQAGPTPPLPLLALGVGAEGTMLHVNWRLLRHVLVCGLPGSGAEVVLASLLTALAARCHPDLLRLWIVAARASFPPPLLDLPHGCDRNVEPTDTVGLPLLVAEVRAELERRRRAGWPGPSAAQPELVLVLQELMDLQDDALLELLARHGAAHGMHLLAATARAAALPDLLLGAFDSRLVLRTPSEEESQRLLGRADAADLGAGGDLWAQLAGREAVRLCGIRVDPDYLDRLVDRMHAAYAEPEPDPAPIAATATGNGGAAPVAMAPELAAVAEQDSALPGAEADAAAAVSPEAPGDESLVAEQDPAEGGPQEGDATEAARAHQDDAAMPVVIVSPEAEQGAGRNGWHAAPSNGKTALPGGLLAEGDTITVGNGGADGPAAPHAPAVGIARIQVHCFGELRVTSGARLLAVQGQHLPWEVLIYLALHEPGSVSKEDLLQTFWPGADPTDSAPRLRITTVRLRTMLAQHVPALPAEVVRIGRDGACRLDPTLVWSDAQQFLACCEVARQATALEQRLAALEAARALSSAGLFHQVGFHWLEQRRRGKSVRQHYRDLATWATTELARSYVATGQPEQAVPLYRELLEAQPTLQAVARELYRCYGALGDRTALLEEHERLSAALEWRRRQAEHEGRPALGGHLEPSTVAVYEEVLATLGGVTKVETGK